MTKVVIEIQKYMVAFGLSIVAGIVVTLIFAYMKGDWPFAESKT